MNQTNIEIDKIRRKIFKIKTLRKEHKTIYADFYELLDSLPLNFTFKLTNINSDIDGYWEKTIYRNNSAWLKGDKILYNSSFFNFIDNVLDAIDQNIESIKNNQLEVNRKASAEARGKLFIENLSREKFCEILDRLPLMLRFELINIREDFDGYWEKTIVNGKTAWRKDDRVLLSQFLFPFKKEVFNAIEGEIGVYHKDKINWKTIRKILFNGEKIQILTSRKGEIALILAKETLEELYFKQNKSLEDIAKKYGTSRQNVMKIMKKYGLIRRTQSKARIEAIKKGKFETFEYHEINEKFFSEWSPEMAWVLGLLFTDGSIDKTRVVIYSIDLDLLGKIKKLLNSSNPIAKRPQSYDKSKHIYEFGFYRENMRGDLNKLGLQERKSLNMVFPDIPEEYMRHFIRGCWDGDGSIFFDRGKLVASYVTGSKNFIEKLVHELFKIGIFKNTKPYHLDHKGIGYRSVKKYSPMTDEFWSKYPDGKFPMTIHMKNINAYYIKIQTRENVEKLFHYFYDGVDESIYLTRKYKIFVEGLTGDQKDTGDYWSDDLPL